jgi:hypothetical protein
MKISIISDIHDNLVNLEKFLEWCRKNKVEKIICCGDITNGETLGILAGYKYKKNANFKKIYLVRGNMEIYNEDELFAYDNIENGGRTAVWNIGGRVIGACHEPFLIKEVFAKSREGNIDIIFYGHTHKPWIEEKNNTKIVNPGTLGGIFTRATFAVYDTETGAPELKILDLL